MLNNSNMLNEFKAFEMLSHFIHFMKDAPRELGMNWSTFLVLTTLASADAGYLSAAEIIKKTGLNRGWAYRTIRLILQKGLIDSQPGTRNQVRLYAVNGKGRFWLQQSLKPNAIALIKAFERM